MKAVTAFRESVVSSQFCQIQVYGTPLASSQLICGDGLATIPVMTCFVNWF